MKRMERRSYLKGRLAATTSGSRSRPTCCTEAGTPASRGRDRACGTVPAWIPVASYEQTDFFGNVVFTNGHLVDGDTVTLYYGASDSVICGARLSLREILQTLRSSAL
jgi:hypothetical protein